MELGVPIMVRRRDGGYGGLGRRNRVCDWYFSDQFFISEYCGCSPKVYTAFVCTSLQHQIAVDSPFAAPTVLDQPIIVILGAVAHQNQSVVWPSRAQQRISHSALIVHQPSKI